MLRRDFRRTPANHTMRLTWTFGNTVFVIRARTVMSWVSESHVLGHSHFKRGRDRYPTRIYRLMITCIRLGAFPLVRDTFNLFSFSTYIIPKPAHNVKSFLALFALFLRYITSKSSPHRGGQLVYPCAGLSLSVVRPLLSLVSSSWTAWRSTVCLWAPYRGPP